MWICSTLNHFLALLTPVHPTPVTPTLTGNTNSYRHTTSNTRYTSHSYTHWHYKHLQASSEMHLEANTPYIYHSHWIILSLHKYTASSEDHLRVCHGLLHHQATQGDSGVSGVPWGRDKSSQWTVSKREVWLPAEASLTHSSSLPHFPAPPLALSMVVSPCSEDRLWVFSKI